MSPVILNNSMDQEPVQEDPIEEQTNVLQYAGYGFATEYNPVDGKIWVVGGYNGSQRVGTAHRYSVSGNQMTYYDTITSFPIDCYGAATGMSSSGVMYILGPNTDSSIYGINTCYKWTGSGWTTVASAANGASGTQSVTIGTKIYVVGGYHNQQQGRYDRLDYFDMSNDSWNVVDTSAPGAGGTYRNGPCAGGVVYDGTYLWQIGGVTQDDVSYTRNNRYDIAGDSWNTSLGTTGHPTTAYANRWYGHQSVYRNGYIYSIGKVVGSLYRTLYVYKIANNTWYSYANWAPVGMGVYYETVVLGNLWFLIGGYDYTGRGVLDSIYTIDMTQFPTP